MWGIIQEVRDLCVTNLVSGTVDAVYLGIAGEQRQVHLKDFPYLIIDDGGEDTISTAVMGHQVKQYNVIFEIGVRWGEEEDALQQLLTRWEALEDLIFHADNRYLVRSGARIAEGIETWPSVEGGENTSGTNVATPWKWRRSSVPYRLGFCRGGYHTPA